jgi:tripartite ATP-independent transporter DctP family solute receptor
MTAWAEAVNEASNGSITIEIYPNGTLGSESDCVSQLQAGGLEMTKVSAGTLGNFKNEWNAVSVPYVFNDKEHYYNVMDGEIAEDLYALTEDDGFIGLTWLDSGSRSFYTADTPIRTPSDLKGLKIRTMDSQMAIDMMTALGGSATVMSYSDIYTGMQNHVVDGAENNITAMRDHADVTKYYCFDEHTRIPDIVVISTKAWNSLSENQQNILKSTAVDMTENYKTLWAEFEDEVRQQAEEAGVEFITDVDTAAFQEACQSIYENLKTSDPDTYAFVERIQAVA